jgi:aerobic-type carbon monoxide dehydrogenase small subunit (CoxS/CutS family)
MGAGTRNANIDTTINGVKIGLTVPSRYTLAELLREKMNLTGTKLGCNRAECGACTVLLDGLPVFSCTVLAVEANGKQVETVEGLSKHGKPHHLQTAFVRADALQCGFCTPGMLLSLKALLDRNQKPTPEEIREAIAGNLCRCGAYPNISRAATEAAELTGVQV